MTYIGEVLSTTTNDALAGTTTLYAIGYATPPEGALFAATEPFV